MTKPPSDRGHDAPPPSTWPNTPAFDAHGHLCCITSVDLTKIDGIDTLTAIKVIGEIGLHYYEVCYRKRSACSHRISGHCRQCRPVHH